MDKCSSLYVGLDVHKDSIDMGSIESVRCTGGAATVGRMGKKNCTGTRPLG